MATAHLVGLRGSVWLERGRYEEAEGKYGQAVAHDRAGRTNGKASHLCHSIEATMSMIQQSLSAKTQTTRRVDLEQRVAVLERENSQLKTDVIEMKGRIAALESRLGTSVPTVKKVEEGFDLFCDEEGEEEAVKPEPVKSKKPPVVAKSTIVLEVKPWEAETDMKEVEKLVRGIACDGLLWKASKLVDVAYGIKKLQISCVVEDEKVSVDFLEESITAFEDYVQSVDIAAFNKL